MNSLQNDFVISDKLTVPMSVIVDYLLPYAWENYLDSKEVCALLTAKYKTDSLSVAYVAKKLFCKGAKYLNVNYLEALKHGNHRRKKGLETKLLPIGVSKRNYSPDTELTADTAKNYSINRNSYISKIEVLDFLIEQAKQDEITMGETSALLKTRFGFSASIKPVIKTELFDAYDKFLNVDYLTSLRNSLLDEPSVTPVTFKTCFNSIVSKCGKRNWEIYTQKLSNPEDVFESLGSRFGISRQRAHQIFIIVEIAVAQSKDKLLQLNQRIGKLFSSTSVISLDYLTANLYAGCSKEELQLGLSLLNSAFKTEYTISNDKILNFDLQKLTKYIIDYCYLALKDTVAFLDRETLLMLIRNYGLKIKDCDLHVVLDAFKHKIYDPKYKIIAIKKTVLHKLDYCKYILLNHGEPMHFARIHELIGLQTGETGTPKRNTQAILGCGKDEGVILRGNGYYALADWGTTPSDKITTQMVRILKASEKPLSPSEVYEALNDYSIKRSTVTAMLSTSAHFYRCGKKLYTLNDPQCILKASKYVTDNFNQVGSTFYSVATNAVLDADSRFSTAVKVLTLDDLPSCAKFLAVQVDSDVIIPSQATGCRDTLRAFLDYTYKADKEKYMNLASQRFNRKIGLTEDSVPWGKTKNLVEYINGLYIYISKDPKDIVIFIRNIRHRMGLTSPIFYVLSKDGGAE